MIWRGVIKTARLRVGSMYWAATRVPIRKPRANSLSSMRFLFYSHDGLGLGHTRRHIAVAAALARICPTAAILVATSAEEVERHGLPHRVEILKLPGLRKESNESYSPRRLPLSADEIRSLRA